MDLYYAQHEMQAHQKRMENEANRLALVSIAVNSSRKQLGVLKILKDVLCEILDIRKYSIRSYTQPTSSK